MARLQSAPANYQCPYQRACPHLGGLSTRWVWDEYQRAPVRENELWNQLDALQEHLAESERRIRELERENDILRAKCQALHRKQFEKRRPSKKAKTAAAQDASESSERQPPRQPKPRGAPRGHPGWSRPKPTRVDRTVDVAPPEVCPHCGSTDLAPADGIHEHVQEDIVLCPRTVVTCYRHAQAYCERCRRPVIRAGPSELPNAPIGPVAKATAIYLRYALGLTYRKVTTLCRDLFGLSFVPASALGFDRQAAARGRPLYEDLREKIRAAAVLHADETSWRQDGEGHIVWFAGNPDLAFFHIDKHRSAAVAKSILGSSFAGVLITDAYAVYDAIRALARQSCLVHIIRHAKEALAELVLRKDASRDPRSESFCTRIAAFFSRACEVARKLLTGALRRDEAPAIEQRFQAELDTLCAPQLQRGKAETLRTRLLGPERDRLFTFLRHPGVPATNNHAEQTLRFFVIFRKLSFGTRSAEGSETHSILASLVLTARRQGVDPRGFLGTLLTADTSAAQAALYRDPS